MKEKTICPDLLQLATFKRVASAPARFGKFNFPLRRQTLYPTELRAHKFILRDLRLAKPYFVDAEARGSPCVMAAGDFFV
jgi:hypothetical protein